MSAELDEPTLAALAARITADGIAIELLEDAAWTRVWRAAAIPITLTCTLLLATSWSGLVGPDAAVLLRVGGVAVLVAWIGPALVLGSTLGRKRRTTLLFGHDGIRLSGEWQLPWSEVGMVVDRGHRVRIETPYGEIDVLAARASAASAFATWIRGRAAAAPRGEVPAAVQRLVER